MGKDIRGHFHLHADLSCLKYRGASVLASGSIKVCLSPEVLDADFDIGSKSVDQRAIADIALNFFYMM
jgi:hypothetical protein